MRSLIVVVAFAPLAAALSQATTCESDVPDCVPAADAAQDGTVGATYAEAVAKCASYESNWRLCQQVELESNICCSTGCQHDGRATWILKTSDDALTYTTDGCTTAQTPNWPLTLNDGGVAAVRCCYGTTEYPTTAAPTTAAPVGTCWTQLCTSCDFTHSSTYPETRVATGQTLQQCEDSCAASATCTAIDFGKDSRAGECYHNTAPNTQTYGSHSNFDAYVPTACTGVSGDPFTTDAQGNKVQFFLPLAQEQLLLKCDSMQLYGRAFASGIAGDHQQWFDNFRVTLGGAEMLNVEISKTNNRTVAVSVMKKPMTQTGVIAYNGVELEVSRNEAKRIGAGYSETVDMTVGNTRMQFMSAAAAKFASTTEQVRYSHLDVKFPALDTKTCTSGILAEIWGVAKMSSQTVAMLKPAA